MHCLDQPWLALGQARAQRLTEAVKANHVVAIDDEGAVQAALAHALIHCQADRLATLEALFLHLGNLCPGDARGLTAAWGARHTRRIQCDGEWCRCQVAEVPEEATDEYDADERAHQHCGALPQRQEEEEN